VSQREIGMRNEEYVNWRKIEEFRQMANEKEKNWTTIKEKSSDNIDRRP
jgi:hypothetical protein